MPSLRLLAFLLLSCLLWQDGVGEDFITFPEDREFLPKSWIASPIDASIEPLKIELRDHAEKILSEAFRKYPTKLKEKYLSGVSIVESLRFYDVGYGGTYLTNSRRIVLVYRESFEDRGFEQRFHHEFSSLLLKQNESLFDVKRWKAANLPGFAYRAGGVVEEQSGDRSEATKVLAAEQKKTGGSGSTLLRLEPTLMKEGFLTAYNQVSVEQDLNETAAHLFTNPDLWDFCKSYPRVDQKVDVLIDFYNKLDDSMDRLFFRNLTESPISSMVP